MEIDIEQIIDRVIKSSSMPKLSHPIEHEEVDVNAYSDVSNTRSDVKYTDPVKQRQQ